MNYISVHGVNLMVAMELCVPRAELGKQGNSVAAEVFMVIMVNYPSRHTGGFLLFYYISPMYCYLRFLILLVSVFLFFACASSFQKNENYDDDTAMEMDIAESSRGRIAFQKAGASHRFLDKAIRLDAQEEAIQGVNLNSSDFGYEGPGAEIQAASAGAPSPSKVRMVNYNGTIHLQSAEPEAIIDTVVQRAKAKGASIDNRRNSFVSLQIPVAEFNNFFNYILTLGIVTNKNIYANDITEAYADNAARLRIAEGTLVRLQQLLAAAKTEQEKLMLLKEIQRVSEQIEQAKLTEKELLRKAEFSTINLWVSNMPQQPKPLKQNIGAFGWFSLLLDGITSNRDKALKLKVPKDFIETKENDHKQRWRAASALNATLQAFERENEPQGTPDFWANAMLEFFKHRYKAELKSEENFSMVRLQSYHIEPEIYYIAILKQSSKKTLKITVAKFPNSEVEQKNSEAVKEVLRRAK